MPVKFTALDPASYQSGEEKFNVTISEIGSSLNCTVLPNQVAQSSFGPGVFTEDQGTRSMRYKPVVPSTAIDYTCSAPFDYNGTFQSLFVVTMGPISTSNGSEAGPFDGCADYSLIVSIDVSTASAVFHICAPQITVFGYRITHKQDGSILSSQATDYEILASSMLEVQIGLLSQYTASFMFQERLSQSAQVMEDLQANTLYDWMFQARLSQSAQRMEDLQANTLYDWPGLLMTRLRSTSSITSVPELADSMWRRVFANWFSTYRDQLLTRRQDGDPSFSSATGTATYPQARMIPSVPAFALSISLCPFRS